MNKMRTISEWPNKVWID